MPQGEQTSFIPKNASTVRKKRPVKRIYIFSYVAYILFFGTLVSTVGAYFYVYLLEEELQSSQNQLASAQESFNSSQAKEVEALDKKLSIAEKLLNQSDSPSKIFSNLETVVVDSVQFGDLKYTREGNQFTLNFAAGSEEVDALIYQREVFASNSLLSGYTLKDFSFGEAGGEGNSGSSSSEESNENLGQIKANFTLVASTSEIPYTPSQEESENDESIGTSTDEFNNIQGEGADNFDIESEAGANQSGNQETQLDNENQI